MGTKATPLAFAETVVPEGMLVIMGAFLSLIEKATVPVAMLPAASLTVTVMTWLPVSRNTPAAGDWEMTKEPAGVQLSLATTLPTMLGTGAEQPALFARVTEMGAGRLRIVGAVVSATV